MTATTPYAGVAPTLLGVSLGAALLVSFGWFAWTVISQALTEHHPCGCGCDECLDDEPLEPWQHFDDDGV